MKARLLIIALLVSFANAATAQTTQTLAYDFNDVPSVVAKYAQTITVDGTLVKTPPTCVALGTTSTTCSVQIPTLASGSHTVSVLAVSGGMSAETRIVGLDPNNAPKNAVNVRIGIVVTINVP